MSVIFELLLECDLATKLECFGIEIGQAYYEASCLNLALKISLMCFFYARVTYVKFLGKSY